MELLERFAQGELEAFETLFRQFQGEVFGWIIRVVRDPGIAEDPCLSKVVLGPQSRESGIVILQL